MLELFDEVSYIYSTIAVVVWSAARGYYRTTLFGGAAVFGLGYYLQWEAAYRYFNLPPFALFVALGVAIEVGVKEQKKRDKRAMAIEASIKKDRDLGIKRNVYK
jgi:hypothetical protein